MKEEDKKEKQPALLTIEVGRWFMDIAKYIATAV